MVFGGRRLCRSAGLEHARLRAEGWAARRGRLYSRGNATTGGNPNLRLTLGQDGTFVVSAAISHLGVKTGYSVYVRQGRVQERETSSEAPRVQGRLWIPEKYRALVGRQVLSGCQYTVEVLRAANGRWRAHASLTPTAPVPGTDGAHGRVGLDMNPYGVAVANVGRDEHPETWPAGLAERLRSEAEASLHKYAGELEVGAAPGQMWLEAPEVGQADAQRRAYLIGVVAKLAVDAALGTRARGAPAPRMPGLPPGPESLHTARVRCLTGPVPHDRPGDVERWVLTRASGRSWHGPAAHGAGRSTTPHRVGAR